MAQKVVRPAFLLLLTVGTVLAANPNSNFGNKIYSKIALGSCTAYDETPQTIWRDVSDSCCRALNIEHRKANGIVFGDTAFSLLGNKNRPGCA